MHRKCLEDSEEMYKGCYKSGCSLECEIATGYSWLTALRFSICGPAWAWHTLQILSVKMFPHWMSYVSWTRSGAKDKVCCSVLNDFSRRRVLRLYSESTKADLLSSVSEQAIAHLYCTHVVSSLCNIANTRYRTTCSFTHMLALEVWTSCWL